MTPVSVRNERRHNKSTIMIYLAYNVVERKAGLPAHAVFAMYDFMQDIIADARSTVVSVLTADANHKPRERCDYLK